MGTGGEGRSFTFQSVSDEWCLYLDSDSRVLMEETSRRGWLAVQASARTFCNNLASSEVFFELSYYFSLVRIIARIILRDGEHEISDKNRDLLMNEAFYWELGISKTSKYVNIFISPLILLTNISLTPLEMRKLISDQPITSTHHWALLYWGTETGETQQREIDRTDARLLWERDSAVKYSERFKMFPFQLVRGAYCLETHHEFDFYVRRMYL